MELEKAPLDLETSWKVSQDFAQKLLEMTLEAAEPETVEEEARVSWRMNDLLWKNVVTFGWQIPRAFNNLLCGKHYPWVENLWSAEEMAELKKK
jgi:hypothetical protein